MTDQFAKRARLTIIKVGAIVGALAALTLLSGCYTRVVGASGFGNERVQVEEPYQESGQLDRWIFGDDPNAKRK